MNYRFQSTARYPLWLVRTMIAGCFAVIVTVVWGWALNLLALLAYDGGLSGLLVARAIGVVFPPLGALLGFFA